MYLSVTYQIMTKAISQRLQWLVECKKEHVNELRSESRMIINPQEVYDVDFKIGKEYTCKCLCNMTKTVIDLILIVYMPVHTNHRLSERELLSNSNDHKKLRGLLFIFREKTLTQLHVPYCHGLVNILEPWYFNIKLHECEWVV